ncbi:hypothetical protein [Terribacillus saccharophilus]|uniref:hypothetical protein n=1 Tax=Terribacillus saccharophilus TaxID=361277 RepID=UPI0039823B6F
MNKKFLIAPFAALLLFLCGCGASATDEAASDEKAKSEATETESSVNENKETSESDTIASEDKEEAEPDEFFASEENSTELPESDPPVQEEGTDVLEADTLESETSSAEPVDGKVTFEGVTFELPSDYISLGEMEEMGIPMVGYQYGSTTISVVAEDISTFPDLTLETYIELAKQQTGYEYTSDETYEVNGKETNELISKMDGFTLQQNTIIHDGTAYIFSFNSMDDTYEQDKEVFKSILESVSFESESNI